MRDTHPILSAPRPLVVIASRPFSESARAVKRNDALRYLAPTFLRVTVLFSSCPWPHARLTVTGATPGSPAR